MQYATLPGAWSVIDVPFVTHPLMGLCKALSYKGLVINSLDGHVPRQEPRKPAQVTKEQSVAPIQVDTDSGEDFEEFPNYRVGTQ